MTNSRMVLYISTIGQLLKILHTFDHNLLVWISCEDGLSHLGGVEKTVDRKICLHNTYDDDQLSVGQLIHMLSLFDNSNFVRLSYNYSFFKITDVKKEEDIVIIEA